MSDGTTVSEIVGDRAAAKTAVSDPKGRWTVILSASDTLPTGTLVPQGAGYAAIQIAPVTAPPGSAGPWPNGSAFSHGTSVSKNNYLYVYVPLYGKRGVLAGALEFKGDSGTAATITGSVQWIKPAEVSGKTLYPEGFQVDLSVTGESYRKPTAPQPGAGFPSTNGISTITLSGGDLAQPLSRTLSISAAGKVSVIDTGAEQLKVIVNVTAGTFSGSFLDAGVNKRHRFSGAVLQTQATGAGAFLGSAESGSVTLVPKK